jgi:L,D-transpeptidase YcbB
MKLQRSFFVFVLFSLAGISSAAAQISPELVRESLESSADKYSLSSASRTVEFYQHRQFRPAWLTHPDAIRQLVSMLDKSPWYGLDSSQYQVPLVRSLAHGQRLLRTQADSLQAEFRVTDAAIHFFRDIAYGDPAPQVSYHGVSYVPDCYNVPQLLSAAIDNNSLEALLPLLEPASAEYAAIRKRMQAFLSRLQMPAFADVKVTSASAAPGNSALIKRLWQLGILDSIPPGITGDVLNSKVREMQRLFNMLPDGVLRSTVLKELNVPLKARLGELSMALNTIRWLHCIKSAGRVVVVNIPSATLMLYEHGQVIMESRIIVGKSSTHTPTLTSRITEVILYPYWMVPRSIATKELLPHIRRNPGYLDANNMQVLNEQGKVVNPYQVNWSGLSTTYFPYVLRQSTGCDNSLGLVKLNFYNPYNVYLHDTPWKVLFAANKRYFSHGCMRVQKAMELARVVLRDNTVAIDTLQEKGCLINQRPIIVPANEHIPVFVLYNTAWPDSAAIVSFHEDVYRRFQ